MKNFEHDILQSSPELKKMPYTVPEGYFSSLKHELATKTKAAPVVRVSFWRRLAPYVSLAAMFVFMVAAGGFFLEHMTDQEDYSYEDFIVFSDSMTNTIYYETAEQYAEASEPDEEDIVEYLIYIGVSAETIENSK